MSMPKISYMLTAARDQGTAMRMREPRAADPPVDGNVLSVLGRVRLGGAEQRAADFMRAQADALTRMSITQVAAGAGVSEPTVVRLCRRLGCTGFPDLKLRVAEGLASGTPYVHREVAIDDELSLVVDKMIDSTLRAVADCRDWLDRAALERAIELLRQARRIDCFGVGLATAWALDAQIKLMRLGVPAIWYPDGQTQAMAATGLRPGDVALVLTIRGSALDLLRAARIARQGGASVIGIARPGTPLQACCDVFLAVECAEDTEIYTPSQSRLLVLMMVDLLTTGLMASLGSEVVGRLRKVKESVAEAHLPTHRLRRLARPRGSA